ncbi:MAG TPA: hypothetical protein VF721_12985 [Pyrinomonadaceae bacterium]|jgi:hypothetical protein
MAIYDDKWFEVWFVAGVEYVPAYLVIVTPNPKIQGEIMVLDLNKNEILFRSKSYEDVYNWLTEDEFIMVDGRVFSDDGW